MRVATTRMLSAKPLVVIAPDDLDVATFPDDEREPRWDDVSRKTVDPG